MTVYKWRNGQFVDADGNPMLTPEDRAKPVQTPMVMEYFKPYACPVTGKEIWNRAQHRENLKRHNCVEGKELPSPTGGEIRNADFARRRGFKLSDRYIEEPWSGHDGRDTNAG